MWKTNKAEKCPEDAEDEPHKIYVRRYSVLETYPWRWLYRTEANLRFIKEENNALEFEDPKVTKKIGHPKGSGGIFEFPYNERLVIDNKLPAYERTFAELAKQIDIVPPNDPHPYHVWYKINHKYKPHNWIELPRTERSIKKLKKVLKKNKDVELDEYTKKYIDLPPTVLETDRFVLLPLTSENTIKKIEQDNPKPDSSQSSESSKNKRKIDKSDIENMAHQLEQEMGVSHDDDEELKKLKEELESELKKINEKNKKKNKKKRKKKNKKKKRKKNKKNDNGGPLGGPVGGPLGGPLGGPVSPNTAKWQTVSKELNDMTQTWQNELNMKFDNKIVTWQLDVIPSMIGLPDVNFSFLPTIDHLYEIASNPLTQSTGHTIVNQNGWESVLEEWDDIEADQTHREDLRKLNTSEGEKAYVKALLRLMNDLRQRIRTLLESGSHTPQAPQLRSNMMTADILAADYNMIGRIAKDFPL